MQCRDMNTALCFTSWTLTISRANVLGVEYHKALVEWWMLVHCRKYAHTDKAKHQYDSSSPSCFKYLPTISSVTVGKPELAQLESGSSVKSATFSTSSCSKATVLSSCSSSSVLTKSATLVTSSDFLPLNSRLCCLRKSRNVSFFQDDGLMFCRVLCL